MQLKQRHDLIPNLIETVKGYASHENGTLDAVIKARNAAISAQGPAPGGAAENRSDRRAARTDRAVGGLSGPQGQHQFPAIADANCPIIENKIAAARRFFNNAVQEYNTGIQQMPAALFAGPLGFTRKEFFDLGETRASGRAGAAGQVLRTA